MNDFAVTVEQHTDRTVVTVAGQLDLHTLPALQEATSAVPLGGTLHMDMSGVSFMDSSGLNLLLSRRQRLHAEGSRLLVTGLQEQPVSVLRLTGAYELIVADGHFVAAGGARRSTSASA